MSNSNKAVKPQAYQPNRFDELTHVIFDCDERGKEWLKIVTDALLMQSPTADPGKDPSYAYYREGENAFVRNILHRIKAYKSYLLAKEQQQAAAAKGDAK